MEYAKEIARLRRYIEQLRLRNQTMREALEGWEVRDCGNGQSVLERGVGDDCERLCGPIPYDCAVEIEGFLAALSEPAEPEGEPVERVPSHRSDELPRYIQIDRLNFRVDADTLTGQELRDLPTPPIPGDYDLWQVGVMGPDSLVKAEDVIDLRGARFYSAPRFINAGLPAEPEREG